MTMKWRPGIRKGKTANPNQESAQMILALSSDQHASVEALISPDPPADPAVEQARRQPASPSPGMAAPPDDSRARVGPCDPVPAPPSQVGDPAICGSACILSPPSTSEQQDACAQSPPRRFTLDALLRTAKVVETLQDKAAAEGGIADEKREAARQQNDGGGGGGRRGCTTIARVRSRTAQPYCRPDGDPELPLPQGEHRE